MLVIYIYAFIRYIKLARLLEPAFIDWVHLTVSLSHDGRVSCLGALLVVWPPGQGLGVQHRCLFCLGGPFPLLGASFESQTISLGYSCGLFALPLSALSGLR